VANEDDSAPPLLDANGAESLLGRGDMLYCLPAPRASVVCTRRCVTEKRSLLSPPNSGARQGLAQYEEKFLQAPKDETAAPKAEAPEAMTMRARRDVRRRRPPGARFGKASTSLIQRRLRVGYGAPPHLIDLMRRDGIVGPADGPKPREILKRPTG